MLACDASRRACRPTAACTHQQMGTRTRPASREACRRAAVKRSQVTFSRVALRAIGAQSGVKGYYPLVGGFPVFALGDLGDEGDAESDNVLHDLLKEG